MVQLYFTNHSLERMTQRRISKKDVEICISFGKIFYKAGVKYHIISKKIIREYGLPEKLNGLCVVITKDNWVLTTFKNPDVFDYTKNLAKKNIKKLYAN